jgi:hypothetical protein
LYRLVASETDQFWIRLKRGQKSGVSFRPLRRVVHVSFESDKAEIPNTSNKASFMKVESANREDLEGEGNYSNILNEYLGDE